MAAFGKLNPFEVVTPSSQSQSNDLVEAASAAADRSNSAFEIKQFARREYPGDYNMQKYVVEQQTESLNWILAYSHPKIPSRDLMAFKNRAKKEYPQDYCMQKYDIEQQIEGFLFMLDN